MDFSEKTPFQKTSFSESDIRKTVTLFGTLWTSTCEPPSHRGLASLPAQSVPRSVLGRVPENGVPEGVSHRVSPGFGPWALECCKGVFGVKKALQGRSQDTFWTLQSLGPKGPGDTL